MISLNTGGLFVLLAGVLLSSCSNTFVDPFENDNRFYTIYGYLDVLEIDHAVRVIPVTRRTAVVVAPDLLEAGIDAEVTSIDLDTGTVVEWEHTLKRFEDGTYGHVFTGQFTVVPGCTYRLIVTRSDGVTAYAETTVPVIRDTTSIQRDPIQFSADSSLFTQVLRMPRYASPWTMQAVYRWEGGSIRRRVVVPYGLVTEPPTPAGWSLTLNVSDDQAAVRQSMRDAQRIGLGDDTPVVLTGMGVQLQLLDAKWDESGGVYDPNSFFTQPEKSNVVNGYGFFGSIGLYVQEWNTCDLSPELGYDPSNPDILGCAPPDSTGFR